MVVTSLQLTPAAHARSYDMLVGARNRAGEARETERCRRDGRVEARQSLSPPETGPSCTDALPIFWCVWSTEKELSQGHPSTATWHFGAVTRGLE
jgi:hypothetical protein